MIRKMSSVVRCTLIAGAAMSVLSTAVAQSACSHGRSVQAR
jgi:hypothetical protein